jgi:hypothetical protein
LPYTIQAVPDHGYLLVEHRGEVTPDEIRDVRSAVADLMNAGNPRRLLIDWRSATRVPAAVDFYFIVDETRPARRERAKCAILSSRAEGELAGFVENVGRNRGLRLKAFTSRESALEWLAKV